MFTTVPTAAPQPPERLPRGPHRLTREVVLASQRGRLISAMADAVAARGYNATTVADVIAGAGVSRKTFYEHFADKEECFLAAYDTGVDLLLGALEHPPEGATDPVGEVRLRTRAYLEALAGEPAFARTFLIEVMGAGPRALERRERVLDRFAQMLRDQVAAARERFPEIPEQPPEVHLAAVGATDILVSRLIAQDRTDQLPGLEDLIVRIQLALLSAPAPVPGA
jgi:AcrR family transcriptional regulator